MHFTMYYHLNEDNRASIELRRSMDEHILQIGGVCFILSKEQLSTVENKIKEYQERLKEEI